MIPQKHLMPSMPERNRSVNHMDGEFERAIRGGRWNAPVLPDRVVRRGKNSSSPFPKKFNPFSTFSIFNTFHNTRLSGTRQKLIA